MYSYIPYEKRNHVYTVSIKDKDSLWVVPSYNAGEVWSFYGGFGKEEYTILEVYKNVSQVHCVDSKGRHHIYDLDRYGYARNGTPSLRIRIK